MQLSQQPLNYQDVINGGLKRQWLCGMEREEETQGEEYIFTDATQ